MPWIGAYELGVVAAAVAAAQLATTARFGRRLSRSFRSPPKPHSPPVSVVIACKGGGEDLEENLASILAQEYGGPMELILVAPSESDPAYPRLRDLAGKRAGARLLVSGAKPALCSEQNLNLLTGIKAARPDSEVLVFADCDIRAPQGWLRSLVAPLEDPRVGVAAAAVFFVPSRPGLWAFLRWVYVGSGLPYFTSYAYANGASCAVRRRDFESCGAESLWRTSINMDLTLSRALRGRGLKVEFIPRALPLWFGDCDRAAFFATFNKWMLHFRLYAPLFWWMGAVFAAGKLLVLALALSLSLPLAAAIIGLDVLNVHWVFRLYRRFYPGYFALLPARYQNPLWAALAAPFLPFLYAVNFASSVLPGTLYWGGYLYQVRGPYDIEARRPLDSPRDNS